MCAQLGLKGRQGEGSVHSQFCLDHEGVSSVLVQKALFCFHRQTFLSVLVHSVARMAGSEEVHIINTLPTKLSSHC